MSLAIRSFVALTLLAAPALAQQDCGLSGVTVDVSPRCAAPGQPIAITVTNNSNQTVTFPTSCLYAAVWPGTLCGGNAVFTPICLQVLTNLAPGASKTQSWFQNDDLGQQVPNGVYAISINYIGSGCCALVAIGQDAYSYCTAKVSSQSCTPVITLQGTASASDPNPCLVGAKTVVSNKNGLLIYGFEKAAAPFFGGVLCIQPPVTRLGVQFSGGNPPPDDCSGSFSFDVNALIQGGGDPLLVPGVAFDLQYWYRDPAHLDGTGVGLSNAVELCIQS